MGLLFQEVKELEDRNEGKLLVNDLLILSQLSLDCYDWYAYLRCLALLGLCLGLIGCNDTMMGETWEIWRGCLFQQRGTISFGTEYYRDISHFHNTLLANNVKCWQDMGLFLSIHLAKSSHKLLFYTDQASLLSLSLVTTKASWESNKFSVRILMVLNESPPSKKNAAANSNFPSFLNSNAFFCTLTFHSWEIKIFFHKL